MGNLCTPVCIYTFQIQTGVPTQGCKLQDTYPQLWETKNTYEFECRCLLESSDIEKRTGVWKVTLKLLTLKYLRITNRDLEVAVVKIQLIKPEIWIYLFLLSSAQERS
jgi:hypothetical protein